MKSMTFNLPDLERTQPNSNVPDARTDERRSEGRSGHQIFP
jgi:hypothetical protein